MMTPIEVREPKKLGRDTWVNLSTLDNIRNSGASPEGSVKPVEEYSLPDPAGRDNQV